MESELDSLELESSEDSACLFLFLLFLLLFFLLFFLFFFLFFLFFLVLTCGILTLAEAWYFSASTSVAAIGLPGLYRSTKSSRCEVPYASVSSKLGSSRLCVGAFSRRSPNAYASYGCG